MNQSLTELIADRGVRAVYQPIVEMSTGEAVAFEALARGPRGSDLEMPGQLFPAAAAAGLRTELERACLGAAFRDASRIGTEGFASLFVNLEPGLLEAGDLAGALRAQGDRPTSSIFVELTERELTANPTRLMGVVDRLRELGHRIALDDVGANLSSLALVSFLDPDVIKLDLKLIQGRPRGEVASIVHAVNADAERTGAVIVAEGIETPAHLERAHAVGATYGQGWLFGRPGPLDAAKELAGPGIAAGERRGSELESKPPFDGLSGRIPVRTGDKALLVALSEELEAHAMAEGGSTVLLTSFERTDEFTSEVMERYARLASALEVVGVLGPSGDPGVPGDVRWGELTPEDPMCGDWTVAVVGPHFAAIFAAKQIGDRAHDPSRTYEFVTTYERSLVVEGAREMMRRLLPRSVQKPQGIAGISRL